MADRRKLQGEIERCLKKVQEGVEFFDDLWQKVQNATNLNIKEKHEADLKKEIKKLQRLRDGIKTWVASSDIKDKKSLLDAKKVIETQMERFKVIERETKTKAYSKEGLGAVTKVDPKEKEKEDITAWLAQSIDGLNVQIDQFESEIESIVSKKKKLDRDKQDQVDQFRRYLERHRFHIDKLETVLRLVDNDALPLSQITQVREDVDFYIASNRDSDFEETEGIYDDLHLEEASAALGSRLAAMNHDNDDRSSDVSSEAPSLQNSAGSISPSPSLAHSKDAADDEIGSLNRTRLKSQSNETGSRSGTKSGNDSGSKSSAARQRTSSLPTGSQESSAPPTPSSAPAFPPSLIQNYAQAAGAAHHYHAASVSSISTADKISSHDYAGSNVRSASRSASSNSNSVTMILQNPLSGSAANTSSPLSPPIMLAAPTQIDGSTALQAAVPTLPSPPSATEQMVARSMASLQALAASAASSSSAAAAGPQILQSVLGHRAAASVGEPRPKLEVVVTESMATLPLLNGPSRIDSAAGSLASLAASPGSSASLAQLASPNASAPVGSLTPTGGSVNAVAAVSGSTASLVAGLTSSLASMSISAANQLQVSQSVMSSVQLAVAQQYQQQQQLQMQQLSAIRLNPLVGIAPLGPQPLNRLHVFQLEMLESVARHLPHAADSQRIRTHFPHSPYTSSAYHYQLPPTVWDNLDFYGRLDIDTLFFIFYYMEGTKAQYLAAKTLKLKSWRFHTKHLMWFQRHDEPTLINEDYEQGSYWYFDFETWTKRRQDNFTFEYRYLEDHELK